MAGKTPVALVDGPKSVLHIVPASSADPTIEFDISQFSKISLLPLGAEGLDGQRFNFDGWLTYENSPPQCFGYAQLFRSGSIEAVDAFSLGQKSRGNKKIIPSIDFEKILSRAVCDYLKSLRSLDVQPPLFFMLSLLAISGYSMGLGRASSRSSVVIDRDNLIIPEVVVESYNSNHFEIVKALVDPVWNACGYEGTPNFDKNNGGFVWN